MKADRFRVKRGERHPLRRERTDFTGGFDGKEDAVEHLEERLADLAALQEKLFAQRRYAVLVILQGIDTAGKDSAIKHVFTSFNPQGLSVHSFQAPSSDELSHNFLWRETLVLPPRGQIGVFNRSYYEEVMVVRVHPQLLEAQGLPRERIRSTIWDERYEDINAFEQHLWRSGTVMVKFFLNISRHEQEKRLLARIDDSKKNWKFSAGDLPERAKWNEYMKAYEAALSATSSRHAPWYVIPADHKWAAHAAMADVLFDRLSELDLEYPSLSSTQRRELVQARRQLTSARREKR